MAGSTTIIPTADADVLVCKDEVAYIAEVYDDMESPMMNCFVCDYAFEEDEEPWLMFERRVREDGHPENPISSILCSTLGCEINEETAHSKFLCNSCNAGLLQYEQLEQCLSELRASILSAYNITAHRYNLAPVSAEINGVLQDFRNCIVANDNETLARNFTAEISAERMNGDLEKSSRTRNLKASNMSVIPLKDEFIVEDEIEADLVELVNDDSEFIAEYKSVSSVEEPESEDVNNGFLITVPADMKVEDIQVNDQDIIIYDQNMEPIKPATENDMVGNDEGDQSDTLVTAAVESSANMAKDHEQLYEAKGDGYVCLICNNAVEMEEAPFWEHMRKVHKSRFYTCDLCNSGFLHHTDLSAHFDEKHVGVTRFDCETCHNIYTNNRLYRLHKRMHNTSAKHYECSECNKKYSSRILLDEHMNTHMGLRPYKCEHCPKAFASKYTLNTHSKIHTKRQRSYQCNQCEKSFFSQRSLQQHKKLHSGIKPFVCEHCLKSFSTRHNLDVHKIVHSGQRPFVCRMCGKTFARRAEIQDHERIHTGERPFQCDLCPMAFAQRSNLMTHKKSTHLNQKLHTCEQCNRSFKRRRLLDYHINAAHTGERPHKCEICGSTFVYPEHKKKHMRIHSGHKPYACEVCGKCFNSRDNRNAHRFVHSEKKPYECLECGAGFMRKPMLIMHMVTWKHNSDTIIINQPHITTHNENVSDEEVNVDDEGMIPTRATLAQISPDDELLMNAEGTDEDSIDPIGDKLSASGKDHVKSEVDAANGINDELPTVHASGEKYLDFEAIAETESLTWVVTKYN